MLPLALLAACQFSRPRDIDPVDAREIDAVDAPPPCTPSTVVCDDAAGVYTECDATGTVVRQLTCPLGCATDTEQCLDIDPHNGLAMYLDMVEDPPDVVLRGEATIDPVTGLVFDDGVELEMPTFLVPVTQPGEPALRVFVVKSMTVDTRVDIAASPQRRYPIAVLSLGDVTVRGMISIAAAGSLAGPGGWPGVDIQHSQGAACIGRPVFDSAPSPGAGGGGGSVPGGTGGDVNQRAGGIPGIAHPGMEPLAGGCAGGGNWAFDERYGGGGGGAIQITSRTTIRIEQGGGIDASGGGGEPSGLHLGGTGGGAGGTIVLEAPQVVLNGSNVVLSTKGGGGSGASSASQLAQPGQDGGTGPAEAQGGTSPSSSPGGHGALFGGPGDGAPALGGSDGGGGGGGAAGNILLVTRAGTVQPANGAAIRGARADIVIRARTIP
ncbi:MAG: hypothetical protein R3B06_11040 [Kofleriaceae bacterium]